MARGWIVERITKKFFAFSDPSTVFVISVFFKSVFLNKLLICVVIFTGMGFGFICWEGRGKRPYKTVGTVGGLVTELI